jgi:precorrin-6B methylase 1
VGWPDSAGDPLRSRADDARAPPIAPARIGSLVVVGTGIRAGAHTTLAARDAIERAEKVLFAVADRAAVAWIRALNPTAEPLEYDTAQPRRRAVYEKMVDRIVGEVRGGRRVCVVFYGHPGVFAHAPHRAMRRVRDEGYSATMLPGISAEDCLLADLGVDPATLGCQSYEATDFLIRPRSFDTSTALILWQIGVIGNMGFWNEIDASRGLAVLAEVLERRYGPDHAAYVYEAAVDDATPQRVDRTPLRALPAVRVTASSTLFVPAKKAADLDRAMMDRLGMRFG